MTQLVKLSAFVESLDELGDGVFVTGHSIGCGNRGGDDIFIRDAQGRESFATVEELFKHPVYERLSEQTRNRINELIDFENRIRA